MLGGSEWRATYGESFILVKNASRLEINFRHTTILPPDFGVEPDYQQERGGMKFAKVPEDGPAGKAALKSGDVLIPSMAGRRSTTQTTSTDSAMPTTRARR
jgi:predicted metalloprotease with PDZ domain